MRKLIIYLSMPVALGITLPFALTAQDSLGFTNKADAKNLMVHGLKEGKWLEYFDDSNNNTQDTGAPYYMLIIYKSGKPYGKMCEYFKSGKLRGESPSFPDSTFNGVIKEYYESGSLREIDPYADGVEDGTEKEYYENGKLLRETPYIKDMKNGIERLYYNSGKLLSETPFTNDKANGIEKRYYESGKLEYEIEYAEDEKLSRKDYAETGKEIK